LRHDHAWFVVAEAPERLRVGTSKRESFQAPHVCTLAPEMEAKLNGSGSGNVSLAGVIILRTWGGIGYDLAGPDADRAKCGACLRSVIRVG